MPLTEAGQLLVGRARQLAAVRAGSPRAVREYAGEADDIAAYAVTLEEAQYLLRELTLLLEQSGS